MDEYIGVYSYAYPDTTHIWLGVDSKYTIEGDAFQTAHAVYQKIVPNVGRFIVLIVILAFVWLGIGIYLTVDAGMALGENGERICYLNHFDKLWTELLFLWEQALPTAVCRGAGRFWNLLRQRRSCPPVLWGLN